MFRLNIIYKYGFGADFVDRQLAVLIGCILSYMDVDSTEKIPILNTP